MPANKVTDYDAEKILDTLVEGKKFFLPMELDLNFQTRLLNHLNVTKTRVTKLLDAFGSEDTPNLVIRVKPTSFVPPPAQLRDPVTNKVMKEVIQDPVAGYLIYGEEPVEKRKKFQGFVIE